MTWRHTSLRRYAKVRLDTPGRKWTHQPLNTGLSWWIRAANGLFLLIRQIIFTLAVMANKDFLAG
jgi:hypothetical protein